jgi:serine/threonine protein kinase
MVPTVLGRFTALRELGRGGSGVVYEARSDDPSEPPFALKVAEDAGRSFDAEAAKLSLVDHPAIVKVRGAGRLPDGRAYLAMDLCRGPTLAERVAAGRIPWREALSLFEAIAGGLSALHSVGVLHRDLKLENVLLQDGRPVLIDLGIAKDTTQRASTLTADGVVRGTPACMAPERFFGQPASLATEVYEAALLFYSLVAGRSPWTDDGDVDQRLDATPLADLADVPEAVSAVVMRALSTRAARRPESIEALFAALRDASARSRPLDRARSTAALATRRPPAPGDSSSEGDAMETRTEGRDLLTPRPRAPRARWLAAVTLVLAGGGAALIVSPGGRPSGDTDVVAWIPASQTEPSASSDAEVRPYGASAEDPAPAATASVSAPPDRATSPGVAPTPRSTASAAQGEGPPPSCQQYDQYLCDHYGASICEAARAKTKSGVFDTPARRAAAEAQCARMLLEAVERDEPTRSGMKAAGAVASCARMKEVSCTSDILADPATKPFCEQGELMARNIALNTTPEQAELSCATWIRDLPRLVAQRRAQIAGDAAAKQDTLEKYGLHEMPAPKTSAPKTSAAPD